MVPLNYHANMSGERGVDGGGCTLAFCIQKCLGMVSADTHTHMHTRARAHTLTVVMVISYPSLWNLKSQGVHCRGVGAGSPYQSPSHWVSYIAAPLQSLFMSITSGGKELLSAGNGPKRSSLGQGKQVSVVGSSPGPLIPVPQKTEQT